MSAAWMMLACSWHLGRVPARIDGARPRVEAVGVAEPGLSESLERALHVAAARRLELGSGPELVLKVESVEVLTRAASGSALAREAHLDLSLSLLTEPPESVRISGVQAYTGSDPLQLEAARRQALHELSTRLVEQAVQDLLVAP